MLKETKDQSGEQPKAAAPAHVAPVAKAPAATAQPAGPKRYNIYTDAKFEAVQKRGSIFEFKGRKYDLASLSETEYKRITTDPDAINIVKPKG